MTLYTLYLQYDTLLATPLFPAARRGPTKGLSARTRCNSATGLSEIPRKSPVYSPGPLRFKVSSLGYYNQVATWPHNQELV